MSEGFGVPGLPAGYEAVRWGRPLKGETYMYALSPRGMQVAADDHRDPESFFLIVRRKYEMPEIVAPAIFLDGWVAMDNTGLWYWFSAMPVALDYTWTRSAGMCVTLDRNEFPSVDKRFWRETLRRCGKEA